MKGKLKYLLFLLIMLAVCPKVNVQAQTYTAQFNDKYQWIPNTFVNKEKGGNTKYQQLAVIARKSDGQFVYCIEPGTPLDSTQTYEGQDYDQSYVANMTQSQWERIQLLAYYGYGYSDSEVDHNDLKWYSVTQFMIWKTVPHGYDIYFADSLNGNRITRYTNEMAEMERLLSNHYATPDFGSSNYEMVIGNTLKLTDNSGVLSKYVVESNSFISANKSGNDLYLTANAVGNTTVSLTKKDVKYSHPTIVYVKPGTQDVVQAGSYDPIDTNINIKIVGGKIAINKVDRDTGLSTPQGDATLKGAVYGVYREDGSYVTEIVTDENGYAKSGYLPSLGRFFLQEKTPSKGYELDTNKYYFDITKENLEPLIPVQEKVIERDVTFFKVYAQNETGFITGEPNVTFDIILKSKNEKYASITTDSRGYASVKLPYGTYIVKQMTSTTNFEKVEDFEITINENTDQPLYKLIANNEITAKLKVVKVDAETGLTIPVKGIKFKIKNLDTGEYVEQTITYPTVETISVFETDENGILYTPFELLSGNYILEELDQVVDGYLWNKEGLEFTIGENAPIVNDEKLGPVLEVKFQNNQVKGQIIINKKGEEIKIEDGTYEYVKIDLEGAIFEIRASEDIVVNGYKYYNKGDLVGTIKTDKDGFASLENLPLGKYTIQEISSSNGNLVDETIYETELVYKDQYTEVIIENKKMENYLAKGDLEFSKTDLTTGKGIADVKVEIFHINEETDERELIFTGITDSEGKIKITDLFVGKFVIIETEAATGYRLSDEEVFFEIKENGEIVKANMTNEKITSTVKIHKVDEDNNPIEGVTIGVYDLEGNLIYSGVTDENGDIEFIVEYGSYYFQEIATLEEFELSDEKVYFDVTEDGEYIQKTLVNELKEIEVPNTSSNTYIDMIAGAIILMGVSLIIISNKRKK